MTYRTRTVAPMPREQVGAILQNEQRAVILDLDDETIVGDVMRFVSGETDASLRAGVLRIATHRTTAGAAHVMISLRPLTKAEKEALK